MTDEDATLTVGSSSAIFACGAARLGLGTGLAGVAGDGDLGRVALGAGAAVRVNAFGGSERARQVVAISPTAVV